MPPARKSIVAALALGAVACAGCTEVAKRPPPDVVLVVIDTLRADRLGVYASESGMTPFLDSFAEQSTVFRHAYAQSPWTMPSMASLLTSRYAFQHGVVDFDSVLPESEQTFPEILAEHGYATGGVTANLLVARQRGFGQGYDHHEVLARMGEPFLTPTVRAKEVGARALAWLDGLPEPRPPVFLYLHFMEPHTPYDPPKLLLDAFFQGEPPDLDGLNRRAVAARKQAPSAEVIEDVKRVYDAEVMTIDRALRDLFAEIERRGLLENALVVVTSDHGEELGERGGLGHGHTLFEELIRIPLLVRAPGQSRGAEVAATVSHVDLAPTILDYAGIAAPSRFEGGSLRPFVEGALGGDGSAPERPRLVLSELHEQRAASPTVKHRRALVQSGEKLLETGDGGRTFYALTGDPGERDPGALSDARRAELEASLERLSLEGGRDVTPQQTEPIDEETRERLRGLGYLAE